MVTTKNVKKIYVIDTRNERKPNHIKHLTKTTNDRKRVEDKNRNKEWGNKQNTMTNKREINLTTSAIILNSLNQQSKCINERTEIVRVDRKIRPEYMFYTRNPL